MRNVTEWLEKTAACYADKIAVCDELACMTFGEFRRKSRAAATALASAIAPGNVIVVFCEKNVGALLCFFAAAYADCCYSFFEPALPSERLGAMYRTAAPAAVVTDRQHAAAAAALFADCRQFIIEDITETTEDEALLSCVFDACCDTDPLYLNFTSGSSGTPKGVAVNHRSTIDFIGSFTSLFGIKEDDVIANQAPFDFDVSVKDIYTAFSVGARLEIVPKRLFSQPAALMDFLCDKKITVMTWAVSALCLITTFHGLDYKAPATVRKVLFSGEVMPLKALKKWMAALPEAEFVNLYGPTEITCNCTYHRIDRSRDYENGIPIGRPFPNKRVFLLDDCNQRVSRQGEIGEICVGGSSLAIGYYNNREETEKRFTENPLQEKYAERIYRTGDLARYENDGELYFSGRKDFQIKYMGHRVELEEIEKQMMRHPQVERAVCLFDEKRKKLWGIYSGTVEKDALSVFLRETLPPYMIPAPLICIEQMPLTANGKIDRRLLSERGYKNG